MRPPSRSRRDAAQPLPRSDDPLTYGRRARRAGVGPETVADVEQRKSVVRRVLDELGETGAAGMALGGIPPPTPAEPRPPRSDELRLFIREAIETAAATGPVVIGAHAASFALAGREGILRVLVTASAETRARRIAVQRGIDEAEAEREIRAGDRLAKPRGRSSRLDSALAARALDWPQRVREPGRSSGVARRRRQSRQSARPRSPSPRRHQQADSPRTPGARQHLSEPSLSQPFARECRDLAEERQDALRDAHLEPRPRRRRASL